MATVNGSEQPAHGYDPNYTEHVINSMGRKTNSRVRTIMTSLIRHAHDCAREVDLTWDEWMMGVNMLNWAGQMSDDKRNEGQLLMDVLGLESLVDEITHKIATSKATPMATNSAILGPFFRTDTPIREQGANICPETPPRGQPAYMSGRVMDSATDQPIAGASVDVWQASTNGLYEQQDDDQPEFNLRGKFITKEDGLYSFYCLRPTPYPVPYDGPAGKLLQLMDRHPYRPAHIHYCVNAPGYQQVVTQIFDQSSEYLDNDSVFAVKDALVVEFQPRSGDPQAQWELEYNIKLAK